MIDNLPPTLTRVDPATQRSAEYIRADVVQAQLAAALQEENRWRIVADALFNEGKTQLNKRDAKLNQALDDNELTQHKLDKAQARIAKLEAAQRWISVDERLPDYGIDVLVYANTPLDRNTWDIARLDKLYGWTFFTEWEFGAPTPTHWMPLPTPPVTNETKATNE